MGSTYNGADNFIEKSIHGLTGGVIVKLTKIGLAMLSAVSSMACIPAHATNGYFLPGAGFRSQGMGGVGIAYGRDSLSTAANPANIVNTGMRGDMGFGVFNPERYAAVGSSAGQESPFGFNNGSESDSKYFIVPEMGFTMPLTETLHFGVAVVGNGGMNTTYPVNLFDFGGTQDPTDKKIGVDMMQLLVPISLGYRVNDDHTIAGSLVLAETRFRAYGLGAFKFFDELGSAKPPLPPGFDLTIDPDHLTNQGFDYSYGAGVKVGWQGEFLDDKLTLGATYASKAYMTNFDKYRGLFAEQGDFDIPENYGIGFAFKPVKNLVIAADVLRINYSKIASIGNPGPSTSKTPYPGPIVLEDPDDPDSGVPTNLNALKGIPAFTNKNVRLGADEGMGFGWDDMTVYKLGVQYGVNQRLQVRAGYNYGKSPIPDDQLTFNVLAPAVVEHHYSAGFTYRPNENLEVSGTYMYVASNSQTSPGNQNIVGAATVNMHQNVFGLSLGWVLDPGPVALGEYGDAEMESIDFTGWYAGFNFGQSRYQDVSATSANTRVEGWKVYTGYEFNKYFGLEGGYANLNDMTAFTGTTKTDVVSTAWMLGAVGSLPLTEKLSITGKLGAAYVLTVTDTKVGTALTTRSGDDDYHPNYGVGVNYALLENFVNLRAEWERFDMDDHNIDLMTAGFSVEF
jgi:long-chain fatty acid transport protein